MMPPLPRRRTCGFPAAIAAGPVFWMLILACLSPAVAQPQPGGAALRKSRLFVLAIASVLRGVNQNDTLAAGKVWVEAIGRRRGFQLDTRFDSSESLKETRRGIEEGSVDLVILDSVEYFGLARTGLMQPALITNGKTTSPISYQLLVHAGAGVSTLEALCGKSVNFYSRTEAGLDRMWVEVMLNERRLDGVERFFSSVNISAKPSAACLPVFFEKSAACVIDGPSWELIRELNSQWASKLRVLASSPPLLEGMLCLHVSFKALREDLLRALSELHQDPQGAQLLPVFKRDRVVPVPMRALDAAREPWTKHLGVAAARRPDGVPSAVNRPIGFNQEGER